MALRLPPRYVLASILCSFGGFLFGMDTGIIGPVTVMKEFTLQFGTHSPTIHGLIVSAILIPAAVSSFFAGKVADVLGRPAAISIGAFIFGLGAVLETGAVHIAMFVVGRIVEGLGEGLYLGTLVVYICEISPPSQRGPLTSAPQLFITLGVMTGFFTCYGSNNVDSSFAWRAPFLVLACLSFVFSAVSFIWLVPSPRWLTLHGRHEEALAMWEHLGVDLADREKVEDNPTSLVTQSQSTDSLVKHKHSFADVFKRDVWKRTFLAVFLMGMQQLSGIDGVLYYAPLLFQQAGLASSQASFLASGVSAIVIFTATIPGLIFSDRWGRRTSIIFGGLGLTACMFIIGSLYASSSVHSHSGAGRWVVIVCIYIFAVIFSISWAVAVKVYAAEIQPQRTRASATSLAHGSNWCTNFLVALTTPILLSKSSYGAYFLWGGCTLCTVVVCAIWMPETRGKDLGEIEEAFNEKKISRVISRISQSAA
ncbi:Hexose transporter [Lachnellula willkommii]|uniref:Hexose transporter n=1 Tax=Lachnellula willkommii TaxID=215461 RepID=A0A559MA25_9HELO|nr:Hexose transporter [Lachnellula willkommii]